MLPFISHMLQKTISNQKYFCFQVSVPVLLGIAQWWTEPSLPAIPHTHLPFYPFHMLTHPTQIESIVHCVFVSQYCNWLSRFPSSHFSEQFGESWQHSDILTQSREFSYCVFNCHIYKVTIVTSIQITEFNNFHKTRCQMEWLFEFHGGPY